MESRARLPSFSEGTAGGGLDIIVGGEPWGTSLIADLEESGSGEDRGEPELIPARPSLGTTDFMGATGESELPNEPILRRGTGDLDLKVELSSEMVEVDERRMETGGEGWSLEGIRINGMDFRCSAVSD